MNQTAHNKGFSLLELLLVLGVMALLLVAMFLVYPRIRDAAAAREISRDIFAGVSKLESISGTANLRWISRPAAVDRSGAFPKLWSDKSDRLNPKTVIPTPYGQRVLDLKATDGAHIEMVIPGLGGDMSSAYFCQRLVQELALGATYVRAYTPTPAFNPPVLLYLNAPDKRYEKPQMDVSGLTEACSIRNTFYFTLK